METKVKARFDELFERYPKLEAVRSSLEESYEILKACYDQGGKLLVAGNGGSAADSEHIVGELMKGFVKKRTVPASFREALLEVDAADGGCIADRLQGTLAAIALTGHTALSTAYANDVDGIYAFAQQVYGYGRAGDVFLAISTSGNSQNVLAAAKVAKALGMKVIGLTGGSGGKLKDLADAAVVVPSPETFKIQEYHLPIYHTLCLMLEETYFEV